MLAGAKMHNWFDSEWDYGFAKGIYALHNGAALVEGFAPAKLLPSHGPVIEEPARELRVYQDKLRELARHYLRGYELFTFAGSDQDRVSKPTAVPHVWRVTPHLYKFRGPDYWPNFTMLLADSGRALVIDCGLFDTAFLDRALRGMSQRLGLKQINACIVTHYHGDHCLEAQWLRENWGAKLWTMDRVADKIARPLRYNLSAPINSYGKGIDSITFDRVLRDGQTFEWEGYTLTADWMPGQTEHHLCLHGVIDALKVAFTGDNIFANPADPKQSGHEAVVARNGCVLEEGYLYAASYLHGLEPDLIIGGHSWVLPEPRQLIQRYNESAVALREALRSLSPEEDYRYTFDPFLLRADPYRLRIERGKEAEVALYLRNYRGRAEAFRVEVMTPPGVSAVPAIVEGETPAEGASRIFVKLRATDAKPGVQMVAFDLTLDGRRLGPWYDMIVEIA
jgi:glyoxylase-like metal-dependent hydrolase (beta-lactamase superfamily II)